ncbi:MAG: thiamine phosphate synthase [Rhodospirillaceae bacterium]|jgi:thiamine-phosphate pyrophosphorylase|nr:thiamine phosphate synthase [Rhodospirillaceae bacterium]MBT4939609.1 thiamine phosphate synthase [Rhodospirillaceae bacterium]MBT5939257.1 thiamine phosphate synthase [Rhodospirillaceae bacterium]MBT7266198.1 thiamine phosphate synthase [Rhodospirillaceae bacterium]
MTEETCRLYLITPPKFNPAGFKDELAAALDGGDVACVQLRLKDAAHDDILRAAEILAPIAQERDVAFLMNDDPVLAQESGCDGVHIGQDDASYADARAALGPDAIVGVTCHDSRHLAIEAADKGADYVAFGAFFPTTTKEAKFHPEPEILEAWTMMTTVPCVAIGGITQDNCAPLIKAGADFLAVVSAIWDYAEGPAAAVKAFNDVIAEKA